MKILVVGVGFSGVTVARLLAHATNHDITIIDSRDHVAGNAYDFVNSSGLRIHEYGPHIWHTNNERIHKFISQFTEWVDYKHKVTALVKDGQYSARIFKPFPPNIETIGHILLDDDYVTDEQVVQSLNLVKIPHENITNAKQYLESQIGIQLTELFFERYSKKMWNMSLEELDKSIVARIPIKLNRDEYYYPHDKFQGLPKHGYTKLIENMLDHSRIHVELQKSYNKDMYDKFDHIFYSGPIDEFFDFKFGELPYRSIKFRDEVKGHNVYPKYPTPVVNFTTEEGPTRVTEWRNFPNCGKKVPSLTFEEPCDYKENDMKRFYPVRDSEGKIKEIYRKYDNFASSVARVTFIGRLGTYRYLDMHMAVGQAINEVYKFLGVRLDSFI